MHSPDSAHPFSALAGMDDSADRRAKGVLVIYLDGQMIFSTDEVSKGNPATRLSFSVAGVQTLRLRVTSYDATDGDIVAAGPMPGSPCTDGATVPTATATPPESCNAATGNSNRHANPPARAAICAARHHPGRECLGIYRT